jgi:hypothetical protein
MKQADLARALSDGANLLAAFLCTGQIASLRAKGSVAEINGLLAEALQQYAPVFRAVRKVSKGMKDIEPALGRLDALVRAGVDFDSPAAVAELRAALRELLGNVGFVLPRHAPGPGVACDLHGRECPALGSE